MRLEVVVNSLVAIPLNDALEQAAIDLRRKRKMSLADAIVAATALAQGGGWVTRNVEDYRHIAGLRVLNPFNPS